MSAVELGKVRPSMKSLEFLAGRLGKSLSYFIQEEAEARRQDERTFTMLRAKDLIARGQATEAIDLLERLPGDAPTARQRVEHQRLLARALLVGNRAARALPLLQALLASAEAAHDDETVAYVERQLAHAHYELREFSEAHRHIDRSIDLARGGSARDPLHLVHCLQMRGSIQSALGRPEDAVQSLEQALELGRDVADPHWLATVYGSLGMARWAKGDAEGAISWMSRSVTLLDDLKNMAMAADMRFNMGVALARLGHSARAREMLEQAARDAERFERLGTVAGCYATLSRLALDTGDRIEAKRLAAAAVDFARRGQDPWAESEALAHLAVVTAQEDSHQSDRLFQQAIALSEKRGLGNRRHLYSGYVELLESAGRTDEAGRWAREALKDGEEERGSE